MGLCNVASGWVGFCDIIIKKPREVLGQPRTTTTKL
jgi:hypothetical protein